jgi:hypothetical protein
MARRIMAIFTLSAFVVFSTSCTVYRIRQEGGPAVAKKGARSKVLRVQTTSRDYFEFREDKPATVQGGVLLGECLRTVEFKQENILHHMVAPPGKLGQITTRDGKQYPILTARPAGDSLICQAYVPVSIPVREIEQAWAKSVNTGATILQTLGFIIVALVVVAASVWSEESDIPVDTWPDDAESPPPPPVYVDFWENYFVDAELHGPSPGRGFKMTEWTAAAGLPADGGKTKVKLSNELNEPKATDELRIFVVDHSPGQKIVPDLAGNMHTLSSPFAPKSARDRNGRDILPLVVENDRRFWMNSDEEKNPRKKEDLRDELIFEFPKPRGAKRAKLLVNATNTAWASDFASSFIAVPGTGNYAPLFRAGDIDLAGGRARDWYREDEFYRLRVWVETKKGWQTRQMVYGGGPFVPRDMVYTLNIGDVPGSTLKIKLMPPVGFWMIDRLAVDYGKAGAPPPVELMVEEAIVPGQAAGDVLDAIDREDGLCLILPNLGDSAEITFTAPPLPPGHERSIFMKTVCRYEIRPDVGGSGR